MTLARTFRGDLASSAILAIVLSCIPHGWAAAAAAPAAGFDVWEYRITGNSVLSARDIESSVYPFLGAGKSIEDVEAARQALEKLYKDRGYGAVFADIPEQDVNAGVVRLQVTEGRVDEVRVKNARYFSSGRLMAELPSLQQGKPLDLTALQAELAAVNRSSADRQVTPVLRAGGLPGTVDVDLNINESLPLHARVELNDRYSADTSRTRASVTLSFDNLFQRFHRLSIQYQTAPEAPEESRVIAATYAVPLDTKQTLAMYAVDTSSDFATLSGLGALSVLGAGRIYGLRYLRQLPQTPKLSSSLSLGVDYKDFEDSILQPDGTADVTPMQYVLWSMGYAGAIQNEDAGATFALGVNFGLRGLGNSSDEFAYKRYLGEPNFFYLRGDMSYEWRLPQDFRLYARAGAQAALTPLISNEQFSIGGADTVRGYLEAERLGDNGVFTQIELRSPSLEALWPERLGSTYLFGFVDGGTVGILEPLPVDGQKTNSYSLASGGVGMRVSSKAGLLAEIQWAYPFRDSDNVDGGDSRALFEVSYDF